jgi:hypothetical protein
MIKASDHKILVEEAEKKCEEEWMTYAVNTCNEAAKKQMYSNGVIVIIKSCYDDRFDKLSKYLNSEGWSVKKPLIQKSPLDSDIELTLKYIDQ